MFSFIIFGWINPHCLCFFLMWLNYVFFIKFMFSLSAFISPQMRVVSSLNWLILAFVFGPLPLHLKQVIKDFYPLQMPLETLKKLVKWPLFKNALSASLYSTQIHFQITWKYKFLVSFGTNNTWCKSTTISRVLFTVRRLTFPSPCARITVLSPR